MRLANKTKRLLRNLFAGRHAAHVDEMTDHNISGGPPSEGALGQALLATGGTGQGIESALQDIRYVCRSLARSPGFSVVVVATLAIGIGASLTMLSLMR